MKKLFKFLFKTLLWLIAILLIVLVVAYLTASMWIKPVVSKFVPPITKTSALLEDADISLFSGRLTLKGLKIGNPAGFKDPYIFELGEISVKFQPKSIFSDKIVVDQVLIKGTQVVAEYNQKAQMNLMALSENIQSSLNQGKATGTVQNQAKSPQKSETKASKSVVIKDLQILDTKLRFAMMGHGATLPLPNIQQKNIGEKKKMTWAESIQMVTDMLTVESIQQMGKAGQKALKDAFKVIESHTVGSESVKGLKDMFSDFNLF